MATIRKRGDAQWQCQIRMRGQPPQSRTFSTRADAERWGRQIESQMDRRVFRPTAEAERTTLSVLLDRYETEVLPTKRSIKPEKSRIKAVKANLGKHSAASLTSAHIAKYRDDRIAEGMSGAAVVHELNLINRVLKTAVIDWGIALPAGLPTALVRKPQSSKPRERRPIPSKSSRRCNARQGELERIVAATKSPELTAIVEFAVETAMRRGEIANAHWEHVDLKKRTLFIPKTKTDEARTIPLSSRAIAILKVRTREEGMIFQMRPDSITQAFERACERAGVKDLRFHDLRHEATSRLFERGLSVMEAAAVTGHKTLDMLKRYTHLRVEDLARKLP